MNYKQFLLQIALCLLVLMLSGGVFAQEDNHLAAFEMRWSPDGRWIGVGSSDGIWIFDAEDFDAEPYHYSEGSEVYVVAFDPLRPYAAFARSDEERVRVIEIETGTEVFSADTPPGDDEFFSVYYDLGYSDDGQFLSLLNTSLLYVLDAETGDRVRAYSNPAPTEGYAYSDWLTALDYNDSAETVLVSDWSAHLLVYTLDSPESPVEHALNISYGVERFETIPETHRIVLQGSGALYTYDLVTGALRSLSEPGKQQIAGFDLSPDGAQVAVGADASWYLCELVKYHVVGKFESDFRGTSYQERIYSLAFSPSGDRVATLQTDGQLKIWDITTGEVVAQLGDFNGGVSQKWG